MVGTGPWTHGRVGGRGAGNGGRGVVQLQEGSMGGSFKNTTLSSVCCVILLN